MTEKIELDGGRIALYLGDCLEILPTIPAGSVDAVVTDPPYSHAHMDGGGFALASKFYAGGAIDFISNFDFTKYANVLFSSPILVACCSRDLIGDYAAAAAARGYTFDLHVWYKSNAIPFTCNTFKSDLEYIPCGWKGTKNLARLPQNEMSKFFSHPIVTNKRHPTEKPVGLMVKYIKVFRGDGAILDPFMGSGSTLVACARLGRPGIGIEIDPGYFKIAVARIEEEIRLRDGKGPLLAERTLL